MGRSVVAIDDAIARARGPLFLVDLHTTSAAGHPFVLFQAARQAENYTVTELIRAMDTLLGANVKLVSSGLDEAMVLQQSLVEIVGLAVKRPGH